MQNANKHYLRNWQCQPSCSNPLPPSSVHSGRSTRTFRKGFPFFWHSEEVRWSGMVKSNMAERHHCKFVNHPSKHRFADMSTKETGFVPKSEACVFVSALFPTPACCVKTTPSSSVPGVCRLWSPSIFRAGRVLFPLLCPPFQTPANPQWLCHPCSQATLAIEHSTKADAVSYLCHLHISPLIKYSHSDASMFIENIWTLITKSTEPVANKWTKPVNKYVLISSWRGAVLWQLWSQTVLNLTFISNNVRTEQRSVPKCVPRQGLI